MKEHIVPEHLAKTGKNLVLELGDQIVGPDSYKKNFFFDFDFFDFVNF